MFRQPFWDKSNHLVNPSPEATSNALFGGRWTDEGSSTSALSPLSDFDAPLMSLVGVATSVNQRRAQDVRVEAPLVSRNGLAMRVGQPRVQAVAPSGNNGSPGPAGAQEQQGSGLP